MAIYLNDLHFVNGIYIKVMKYQICFFWKQFIMIIIFINIMIIMIIIIIIMIMIIIIIIIIILLRVMN